MNNREHLNTLSDEEFANEWLKIEKMLHGDCGFHIEVIMQYLQAEHITTADEDFAEIGFVLETTQPLYICYADDNGRLLYILKHNNEYDTNNEGWNDELVDTVRTIADKKRKEMGW